VQGGAFVGRRWAAEGASTVTATRREEGDDGDAARQALLDAQVGSFRWDSEEAVDYEVALEAINRAVGALNGARRRARVGRDTTAAADLSRQIQRCHTARVHLDPADRAAVRATIRGYYDLAARSVS